MLEVPKTVEIAGRTWKIRFASGKLRIKGKDFVVRIEHSTSTILISDKANREWAAGAVAAAVSVLWQQAIDAAQPGADEPSPAQLARLN